jgi:hypothetical protein
MYFIQEGTGRQVTGKASILDKIKYNKNIIQGIVVSVTDPQRLGRIKVRVKGSPTKGGDDGTGDDDLPWALPLLPKLIGIQPKKDEAVLIFLIDENRPFVDRLFLGPINSQPQLLDHDPYFYSAWAGFSTGSEGPAVSVDTIPELKGVFPNTEDISIQGRYNTDITQKRDEIVLRAGKFVISEKNPKTNPFGFKFNSKTQAYIQIKNDVVLNKKRDDEAEIRGTVTNIVANKINLLTHQEGSPRFDLTNPDNLISEDELVAILGTDEDSSKLAAHQLPFGDVLLEYLILMKECIFSHVHNGNGNPPTDLTASGNKQSVEAFKKKADELEKSMLSKNIRIN